MIDIDWIISEENKLSERAKFDLGDNYMLLKELLVLSQSIISISKENEVAHFFETQLVNDLHLAAICLIRRHSTVANFLIRHAIESLVLFTYSMENKKESDFNVKRDQFGIIEYSKVNANKFFEQKFPKKSEYLEGLKKIIDAYYSHSNIYSSQYNTANIADSINSSFFDIYTDEFIRDYICVLNDLIVESLLIFINLQNEYKSFSFKGGFLEKFQELHLRHIKIYKDFKQNKNDQEIFPEVTKIQEKLKEKYGHHNKGKLT